MVHNLAENLQLHNIIEINFIYKTMLYCAYNKDFTRVFFQTTSFLLFF